MKSITMGGFNSLNGAINIVRQEDLIFNQEVFQFLKWCD